MASVRSLQSFKLGIWGIELLTKLFALFLIILIWSGDLEAEEKRHLYLLSNPSKAEISIVSPTLHYWGLVLSTPLKATIASALIGFYPAVVLYASDPLFWPAMAPTNSLAELKFWSWRNQKKLLSELKNVEGMKTIRILSLVRTNFEKFLARSQSRTDVITIETEGPLPINEKELRRRGWKENWGSPIAIADPHLEYFDIQLMVGGKPVGIEWKPTLQDFFDREPIPDGVLQEWRNAAADKKADVSIHASLVNREGQRNSLGPIAEGVLARKLIKPRLLNAKGRSLPLLEVSCVSVFKKFFGSLIRK